MTGESRVSLTATVIDKSINKPLRGVHHPCGQAIKLIIMDFGSLKKQAPTSFETVDF